MRGVAKWKHITLHRIENTNDPEVLFDNSDEDHWEEIEEIIFDLVNENEALRQALHIEGHGDPMDTRVYLFGIPITEVCDRVADYEKMKLKLKKAEDVIHQWEEYSTYLLIHGFTDLPERYEI